MAADPRLTLLVGRYEASRVPRTPAEDMRFLARVAYSQGRRLEATELYRKADVLETAAHRRES